MHHLYITTTRITMRTHRTFNRSQHIIYRNIFKC